MHGFGTDRSEWRKQTTVPQHALGTGNGWDSGPVPLTPLVPHAWPRKLRFKMRPEPKLRDAMRYLPGRFLSDSEPPAFCMHSTLRSTAFAQLRRWPSDY